MRMISIQSNSKTNIETEPNIGDAQTDYFK